MNPIAVKNIFVMRKIKFFYSFCIALTTLGSLSSLAQTLPQQVSGIYPSLAIYNNEGECGTGAVVPWVNRLWVISYGPHLPFGSSDKLYEITSDLKKITRPEGVGGTPANRLIHRESNQLFIGPYAIDDKRHVRVIPIKDAPGRLTGMARSLTDPLHKVILATMEEGFYEVDTRSLKVKTWFKDGNVMHREGAASIQSPLLNGAHGKGFYSGQGVYIFANNGEDCPEARINPRITSGVLAEYDGNEWHQIRRNQFTEITGPGGIYGNNNPNTDPIWTLGWDYKSVLLGVRDAVKGWSFYRVPKASNSYDGAHGWNTEWPRIRNIGSADNPNYLMTMHGMFWSFPKTLSRDNMAGLRPMSSYLKVIGDFCRWNNKLVFGCDDSAKSEFLNTRKAKGNIAAPGQSQSNLWFTSMDQPWQTGTTDACGSVWQNEIVKAESVSDPFLWAGWTTHAVWINNKGTESVLFSFELDKLGNGDWQTIFSTKVESGQSARLFLNGFEGEWIRVRNDKATEATVSFVYSDSKERTKNVSMFDGIASINDKTIQGGLLYALGDNHRTLGILANMVQNGLTQETGYYEMDGNMNIVRVNNSSMNSFIHEKVAIPSKVVTVDKGSYLIVDDSGRRWRLPLGDKRYGELMEKQALRICREVSTERDLFSCGGTFYELPAENADGYAKIRPISSHSFQINDYASYRGMLVMTGLTKTDSIVDKSHVFTSADEQCSVWAGVIDDLWKLGKPVGHGGPWVDADTQAGVPSDPYLLGYYDRKTLILSHKLNQNVKFTVQMDPTGDGQWMEFATYTVKPGERFSTKLPDGFVARWVRFITDSNVRATAWLDYD